MLRFPCMNMVPPGGWQYTQRETNTVICGGDWQDLLFHIAAHRKANNLPIGAAWEDAVEFDICEELKRTGKGWCKERTDGLGDVAYNQLHRIAISIDQVAGTNLKECGGCKARREMLNKIQI